MFHVSPSHGHYGIRETFLSLNPTHLGIRETFMVAAQSCSMPSHDMLI